jgi:hypothetical protein
MKFKTMLASVLLAGSMQNALGMDNKRVTPLGFQQSESKDSKLKQCLKSIMLCECLGLQKKADKSKTESPEIIFEGGSMEPWTQNPPIIIEGGSVNV